jgi:hypothetical protein
MAEPEGPAPQAEESAPPEDKTFPARLIKSKRISVTRSLTRKAPNGDYVKIVETREMDIVPSVAFGEAFSHTSAEIREDLEEAFEEEKIPARSPAEHGRAMPATLTAENEFEKSPLWKQSTKKKNLRTIRVTAEVLNDPVIKRLYDMVRETKSLQVLQKRYTIFKSDQGGEFLSEWSKFS